MSSGKGAARDQVAVSALVTGGLGLPLKVTLSDAAGRTGSGVSSACLQLAKKAALQAATVSAALGELGDTPLSLCNVELDPAFSVAPGLFLPLGEIKAARRDAVSKFFFCFFFLFLLLWFLKYFCFVLSYDFCSSRKLPLFSSFFPSSYVVFKR